MKNIYNNLELFTIGKGIISYYQYKIYNKILVYLI